MATDEVLDDYLRDVNGHLSLPQRAALSHWIFLRQPKRGTDDVFWVDNELVQLVLENRITCPTPALQAANIIRYIGDQTRKTGEAIEGLSPFFPSSVGCYSREGACQIIEELIERGLLVGTDASTQDGHDFIDLRLTLAGWQSYEDEIAGELSGNYGFIALKFNDVILDPFLNDHIKPAVQSIGMDLFDMRDVSQAGLIDNILRVKIRDARFVLVDLTHDNAGAYWEAGYAEGLGKPVLYICERKKFEEAKTHFDTNHCTTVCWDTGNPDQFRAELIATLRRTLES
ncbi:MAG: hypothetical protein HEQ22_04845 [Sphingopyxis sp.]|uniref:hypothetical protein n=1 Tax=Sphingopyxis sp. TaxID=1908224 RepID=UPI003D80E271